MRRRGRYLEKATGSHNSIVNGLISVVAAYCIYLTLSYHVHVLGRFLSKAGLLLLLCNEK